jgi:hypothetical protein
MEFPVVVISCGLRLTALQFGQMAVRELENGDRIPQSLSSSKAPQRHREGFFGFIFDVNG